jgi:hypothetical protein
MDEMRRDLSAAFGREQSTLGNLGGTPERLLQNALTARSVPTPSRVPLFAGIAAVLLVALVVGTFAFVRAGNGPRHGQPVPAASPRPSPSASSSTAPIALTPCTTAEASYGLIISGGKLEMIGSTGCQGPKASIAPSSVQMCADGLPAALAPPVSASNDKVYFRDGDTKVRLMTPDGRTGDVTTVPGGLTTVSFFSVSPDDQRIAVVVEDLSPAQSIGLRLYVEDLGGGHHSDIYATTIPKGLGGLSLWPMGWHQGNLVLAAVYACSATPVTTPYEWRVVSAATAERQATVVGSKVRCLGGFWQSPAGVACSVDNTTFVNDWSGKFITQLSVAFGPEQAQLSPAGRTAALVYRSGDPYAYGGGGSGFPGQTDVVNFGQPGLVSLPGQESCLWIDDGSLLAPDAVIAYPSGAVTTLPAAGTCVGRFPGNL